jgi:hypothetical protein
MWNSIAETLSHKLCGLYGQKRYYECLAVFEMKWITPSNMKIIMCNRRACPSAPFGVHNFSLVGYCGRARNLNSNWFSYRCVGRFMLVLGNLVDCRYWEEHGSYGLAWIRDCICILFTFRVSYEYTGINTTDLETVL